MKIINKTDAELEININERYIKIMLLSSKKPKMITTEFINLDIPRCRDVFDMCFPYVISRENLLKIIIE